MHSSIGGIRRASRRRCSHGRSGACGMCGTGRWRNAPTRGGSGSSRLAKAQSSLSRKQKGSKNRYKVARIYARIADRRRDHLHKLSIREWTCENCGVAHDRDHNAARNILAAGLVAAACGEGVRPLQRHAGNAALVETGTSTREG